MTCGTCKLGRKLYPSWVACRAPIPALPPLPESVTTYVVWPPRRLHMHETEGAGCPCYEPRKPVKEK